MDFNPLFSYNYFMNRAFSLVELSIVLVILGLLTGGILAGQSLIRAAELRAVSTEFTRFVTATQTFRDKYLATPGDMLTATRFWGTAASCPGTFATPSTSIATCNGNGDGTVTETGATKQELFRYWHHLANAGLIEGSYTGVPASGTIASLDTIPGQNAPASRLSNSGWSIRELGNGYTADAGFFNGDYPNHLEMGAPTATTTPSTRVLTTTEMWNLDTKLDDGLPARGRVLTRYWNTCTNAANATVTNATYLLTATGAACVFVGNNPF